MYRIPSFEASPVVQSRVDKLILKELKNYLHDPKDMDRIGKPDGPLPETPDFPITPEEAGFVNAVKVMSVMPPLVVKDLREIFPDDSAKYNVYDFVSRKLFKQTFMEK